MALSIARFTAAAHATRGNQARSLDVGVRSYRQRGRVGEAIGAVAPAGWQTIDLRVAEDAIHPSLRSWAYASTTTPRETPRLAASVRDDGSCVPGASSPARIRARS